ncbi:hypothetical protein [Ferribacterium limneticum]|uniref:hypothetical protein n=1 Tax=Ferribacterium limneticum TaxID=76259 RepID=UPI001CF926C3|nr:hypothetical protein [Ferribacterium limneticum]UCV21486.1 hypothetical protein KI613_13135 [Ferribacterium limneticum]
MNPIAIYPYKEDPEIRKMRVQAWFRAVSLESGLTPRELERKFSESETEKKVKRSCVWNKYRRGEVVPRSGLRPDGGVNLVDRVEAVYPGTAKWLTLPLWRLLDKAPMEMSEIRRCYESLPRPMRAMFILPNVTESSVFWRPRELNCKKDGELLLRFEDLDGFTALIAVLRETESAQLKRQNEICMQMAHEYVRCLTKDSILGECMQRLSAHCFGASARV